MYFLRKRIFNSWAEKNNNLNQKNCFVIIYIRIKLIYLRVLGMQSRLRVKVGPRENPENKLSYSR